MNTALIIIDMQNDFLPGGSLAVEGGDEIIPVINALIPQYELVLATQDWHPANHLSFASMHEGKKVFDVICLNELEQVLWPDHCIQGTFGAAFTHDVEMNKVEAVFRKGMNPAIDSYSGFFDNGKLKSTGLAGYLKEKEIHELHFCGLAADFCVYYSIKDALSLGFKTVLIKNATKAIDPENFQKQQLKLLHNPEFSQI